MADAPQIPGPEDAAQTAQATLNRLTVGDKVRRGPGLDQEQRAQRRRGRRERDAARREVAEEAVRAEADGQEPEDGEIAQRADEAVRADADAEDAAEDAAARAVEEVIAAERERLAAEEDIAVRDEAAELTTMPMLCSGRMPVNPVLIKARIDPEAVFGKSAFPRDQFPEWYHTCPPNVPLFTTACGLKHMQNGGVLNANGKRGRSTGDEMILPVTAYIPSNARIQTFGCLEPDGLNLIFVGISYNSVSKTSLVTVASGGQMPIPHAKDRDSFHTLLGTSVWWTRSEFQYGDVPNFRIAVPTPADDIARIRTTAVAVARADDANEVRQAEEAEKAVALINGMFAKPDEKCGCRMIVQQATMMDAAVLLGT